MKAKVGSVIIDYEYNEDRGIVLAIDDEKGVFVYAFDNGYTSWLPHSYIKKCEVANESR